MAILEMRNITKTFPGVKALDNVSLTVEEGDIHALVGENGAGKSTLMNVLSGVYPFGSYSGEIYYDGAPCRFSAIGDSEKKGIAIIHQELALIPELSIGENMFLGNEQVKVRGVIDWNETHHKAEEYLRVIGLEENTHTLIKDIGVGKQQMVEIAKALSKNVRLLILDEPTSSLNEHDAQNFLDLLLDFKKTRGITSIIISHKLSEVSYVADKITVIRDGKVIETLNPKRETVSEDRIIKGMVGRELSSRFPQRSPSIGEKAMEIRNWTVYHPIYTGHKLVDNVSLYTRKGEVVGIAGLIGAGRTELCQSVFGKAFGTKISGEVFKDGTRLEMETVSQAIENGFAYVTEDRKGDGLILQETLMRNITLPRLDYVSTRGAVVEDLERRQADEFRERLGIRAPDVYQLAGNLSGGNQQKVLLAKWIYTQPDVLLLDEPTRGIDVGSKYEVYCIINQLVAEGKSVLMVSSEMPELAGMCDRIYVMYEGRIVGELTQAEATQERIMGLIMQASKGDKVS